MLLASSRQLRHPIWPSRTVFPAGIETTAFSSTPVLIGGANGRKNRGIYPQVPRGQCPTPTCCAAFAGKLTHANTRIVLAVRIGKRVITKTPLRREANPRVFSLPVFWHSTTRGAWRCWPRGGGSDDLRKRGIQSVMGKAIVT